MAINNVELEQKRNDQKETTTKQEFHPVENYNVSNNKEGSHGIAKIFGILLLSFIIILLIAFLIFTF